MTGQQCHHYRLTQPLSLHHHSQHFLVGNENKPNIALVSEEARPGLVECLMLWLAGWQDDRRVVSDERWQVVMPPVLAATAGVYNKGTLGVLAGGSEL